MTTDTTDTALTRVARELASQEEVRGALGLGGELTVDRVTEVTWQLLAHRDQVTNLIAVVYYLSKAEVFAGKNKPWLAWGMQFRDVSDRQCYTYAKAGELIWEHVGDYPILQYLDLGKLEILHSCRDKQLAAFHNVMTDPTVQLSDRSFSRQRLRDVCRQWLDGKALPGDEPAAPTKPIQPELPWERLLKIESPEKLEQHTELMMARAYLGRFSAAVQAHQAWTLPPEERIENAETLEAIASLLRGE